MFTRHTESTSFSFTRVNEQRHKENANEERRERDWFRNSSRMNGDARSGGEEKSVSCLLLSLELRLYFVITGTLSHRVCSRLPLISRRGQSRNWNTRRMIVSREERPLQRPNYNRLNLLFSLFCFNITAIAREEQFFSSNFLTELEARVSSCKILSHKQHTWEF